MTFYHAHDDAAGLDLTRLNLTMGWCYDGYQITWWTSPPDDYHWWRSGTGWTYDGGYAGDTWVSQPTSAEGYAMAYYHHTPSDYYYHSLYNEITFYGNGATPNCTYGRWGDFVPGAFFINYCQWN